MPPVRRVPGSMKPGTPTRAEVKSGLAPVDTETPATATSAEVKKPEFPWSSPSEVSDKQGLSMMLFSMAGHGKTTLGLTMLHSLDGGPMLIVNLDEELRSISDLTGSDVQVWPGEDKKGKISSYGQIQSISTRLLSGRHPFKCIMFDTLNSLYDKFALPDVKARNPGAKDPRQLYGEANDMVLELVSNFSALAREKGLNVVFTCHAEEKQVGENGPIFIRPKITPGVVQGINQRVSLIGYLSPPVMGVRTLQLAPSKLITAKIHQPRTGQQVPDKLKNPDLGKLIDTLKYKKPYPKEKSDG